MDEDPRDIVRSLSALAGLSLSSERTAALALAWPVTEAVVRALAAVDCGDVEPADRFLPPRGPR